MSISIRNDGLTEASQTGRAGQVFPSGRNSTPATALSSSGTDRIDISSLAEQVALTDRTQAAPRAERVGKLTTLYQSGGYNVNSLNVGRALVASAINAGSMGLSR